MLSRLPRLMGSFVLPTIAFFTLCFASWHVMTAQPKVNKTDPPIAPTRAPTGRTVAGAGIVEAKTENIAIGAHVAGVVDHVYVERGGRVRSGEPLFELDIRHVEAEVKVRRALLTSASAQLKRLESMPRAEELPGSDAKVWEARATLHEREDSHRRIRELFAKKVVSEEELVRSRQGHEVAQAQVAKAEAEDRLLRSGAWESDKVVARAAVEHAQAELDQSLIELARHRIVAPKMTRNGEEIAEYDVLQVNVRAGEYLSTPSSQPAMILGAAGARHVRVDVDEHDIARFQPGTPAHAYARGNNSHRFELKFVRVEPLVIPKRSLTGDNSERVDTRVLQVIYSLPPKSVVYIGQQLDVYIDAEE